MFLRATAKINLCLDVLGKRPDGYHDVKMVMQMVGMYDRLHLYARKRGGISGAGFDGASAAAEANPAGRGSSADADSAAGPESSAVHSAIGRISLTTNLPFIPTDDHNLAVRAARLLMEEKGVTDDLEIRLGKFIPVAAGLAGGSSDAAMTMVGVNRLFHLGFTDEELMERGKQIGADVPYCILRGTALAEGIGEKLTVLPDMPACGIVLAKPACAVSTKEVYGRLQAEALAAEAHPDADAMMAALAAGDLDGICERSRMTNVLETVTAPRYPIISELEEKMCELGALRAIMSGSGPTVFGIFRQMEEAQKACTALRALYPQVRSFATAPAKRDEALVSG